MYQLSDVLEVIGGRSVRSPMMDLSLGAHVLTLFNLHSSMDE